MYDGEPVVGDSVGLLTGEAVGFPVVGVGVGGRDVGNNVVGLMVCEPSDIIPAGAFVNVATFDPKGEGPAVVIDDRGDGSGVNIVVNSGTVGVGSDVDVAGNGVCVGSRDTGIGAGSTVGFSGCNSSSTISSSGVGLASVSGSDSGLGFGPGISTFVKSFVGTPA